MARFRHHLHRWATGVLLAWLFGLGSGVVHACMTPQAANAAPPGTVAASTCHDAAAPSDGGGNANCRDFCGKATQSLPSPGLGHEQAQAFALVAACGTAALPVPAFVPVWRDAPRSEGTEVPAPPIPIAFGRLAR